MQAANQISLEEAAKDFFAVARTGGVNALSGALDEPATISRWHREIRELNLPAAGLKILTDMNLPAGVEWLKHATPLRVGKAAANLGCRLAAAGVAIEQVLLALALLLDKCLKYATGAQSSAVTRLGFSISAMMAAGYSIHWNTAMEQSSKDRADLRRRLLNASASVIEVYETERRRLSHDLHDDIGQDLMLLKLYLEVLDRDRAKLSPRDVGKKLDDSLAVAQHAIQSTRRLVLDLGPAILDELGFLPALRSCARQFSESTGIHIDFRERALPDEIPPSFQVALYRVLQGALGNVFQHSRATNVRVEVGGSGGTLILEVEDDGVGFDIAAPRKAGSVGLMAMRERIEVLGGNFYIQSQKSGARKHAHGTKIRVEAPLPVDWELSRKERNETS